MNVILFAILMLFTSSSAWSQSSAEPEKLSKSSYKIGIFASPPLSDLDLNKNPTGLVVDLLKEISRQEGFEIEWVYEEWAVLIEKIKTNQIDMITSVGYTEERSEFMDYSTENFITVWGQVYLPPNSKIEGLIDLDGLTIATMKNDVNALRFMEQCNQFEITCNTVEATNYPEVFRMVSSGEVDAGVSHNLVGGVYAKDFDMIESSIVFNPFKVFVAVPKGSNQQLLATFNRYISEWKNSPESFYFQTRYKWLKKDTEQKFPAWVWGVLIGLFVLAVAAMILASVFKQQVNARIEQLSKRQIQFNQIINLIPYMIYASDSRGNIILANQSAGKHFGMGVHDFENSNIIRLAQKNKDFGKLLKNSLTTKNSTTHSEIESKDALGVNKTLYMSRTPFLGYEGLDTATVTVAVDITEIKDYEKKIRKLALYDTLTGLPNRILLKEKMQQALDQSEKDSHTGAILHIDLDTFKNINDSRGHGLGDEIIKGVAQRLSRLVTRKEVVGRLGGDEFMVLLPNINHNTEKSENVAKDKAETILEEISKPYKLDGEKFYLTASIGIVIYPRDGDTPELLVQRADTAMYKAKDMGRNQVFVFSQYMEAQVIYKHTLENELRQAEKKGQFNLVYQPIYEGKNRKQVGSEALLRWNHPTKGVISPVDFIEIAENTKIINSIGEWVIERACRRIRLMLDQGRQDFFISVNLSVMQIKDDAFYPKVMELVEKYQVPKGYLEMEVTESILMKETKRSSTVLKQLKLLGIKISIDDFGTGYSSFNYLIKLPLDKIKIDKSFVDNIHKDETSETIIRTVIRMAKELNMDVVAEGIETKEQFDFLLSESCKYFQGYYFSKPIPFDDLMESVENN